MPLRFRQRLKILPGIYLNLGKDGISTTIGPRGANINIGKKGVYLNTGIPGTGISNREKLFGGGTNNLDNNLPDDKETIPPLDVDSTANSTQQIITSEGLKGLKEHLEESKKERELLVAEVKEISDKLNQLQLDFSKKQNGFFSFFTKQETIENLQNEINETSQSLNEIPNQYEESRADINIHFENEIEEQYKKVAFAFAEVINSNKIWDITTEVTNTAIKSSAKSLIERKEVKFKSAEIDFIKCDYSAFHLQNSNGSDLFIYPAFILLIDNQGEITLVDLKELNFNFYPQRFQEDKDTIPADSKIIDYTWYKVNKDGSRDMRFAANFQIPIVKYGAFKFDSSNGLSETYNISNAEAAEKFADEFSKYLDLLSNRTENKSNLIGEFSKQYYDLLIDFSHQVVSIAKVLGDDESLFQKLKITNAEAPEEKLKLIIYCIIYDFCQILKILNKDSFKERSLELIGIVLLNIKLINQVNPNELNWDYQSIVNAFNLSQYRDVENSIIDIGKGVKPLDIKFKRKDDDELISSSDKSKLSLPVCLKITDPSFI